MAGRICCSQATVGWNITIQDILYYRNERYIDISNIGAIFDIIGIADIIFENYRYRRYKFSCIDISEFPNNTVNIRYIGCYYYDFSYWISYFFGFFVETAGSARNFGEMIQNLDFWSEIFFSCP